MTLNDLDSVHIAVDSAKRSRATKGVRRHVVEGDSPIVVRGIRTTSFERTVFDCMRTVDFGMAVAVSDHVLRQSKLAKAHCSKTGQSKSRYLAYPNSPDMRKLKGSRRAVIAMLYADPRSESVGESLSRAAMIEMGFALPDLQTTLPHPLNPDRKYRVDFCWLREDGVLVIDEFDGAVKYEDPEMRGGISALIRSVELAGSRPKCGIIRRSIPHFGREPARVRHPSSDNARYQHAYPGTEEKQVAVGYFSS